MPVLPPDVVLRQEDDPDRYACYFCCGCTVPEAQPDPLEPACYFGILGACCRYEFCRPEAPGLYRATISQHPPEMKRRGPS